MFTKNMSIDLHWISENGETRQMVADDGTFAGEILSLAEKNDSVCVRFIDPFGETVFNQSQIPFLRAELEAIPKYRLSAEALGLLTRMVKLVDTSLGKTQTYLKFYGD